MEDNKGYRKFKLIFHAFIFVFAIGVLSASLMGWNEMDRALLYMILGIVIAAESIYGFYKNLKRKSQQA